MLTKIHIQTKLNHIACLKMTRETTFKTKHWLQLISSLSVLLGKQVMEMLWCLGFRAFLVSFRVFFFFFSTCSISDCFIGHPQRFLSRHSTTAPLCAAGCAP